MSDRKLPGWMTESLDAIHDELHPPAAPSQPVPEPPPTDPNSGRSRDPNTPPFTKRFLVVDPAAPTEQDFKKLMAEIRARCKAATEGPWAFAQTAEKGYGANVGAGVFAENDDDCEHPLSGDLSERSDDFMVNEPIADLSHPNARPDAEFIAHARTDIPLLLDAFDSQEVRIRQLEAERSDDSFRLDWLSSFGKISANPLAEYDGDWIRVTSAWDWCEDDNHTLRFAIDTELHRERLTGKSLAAAPVAPQKTQEPTK